MASTASFQYAGTTQTRQQGWKLFVKRGFDLVLGSVLLVLAAPVMGLAGIAVWFSDGRPLLYQWRVVGHQGKPFLSWKFRTMVRDADKRKRELMALNEMAGPAFKMRNDPRITKVGRVLRRYSLDELPQLWSVIKGDMSLVGPRPPLVTEFEHFEAWQKRKLSVIPGLTCLWQTMGRADIKNFDEWARMDLRYIDNWSLFLDLKILIRTFKTVVLGHGAY
jgi:lipopolysaccharide/colanic/teichoic acid biosynthesis glycosyltransferase